MEKDKEGDAQPARKAVVTSSLENVMMDYLSQPAPISQPTSYGRVSNFMHLIWLMRIDLQASFDLSTTEGQISFIRWYEKAALKEYGIPPVVPEAPRGSRPPSPLYFRVKAISVAGRNYFRWVPLSVRRLFRRALLWLGNKMGSLATQNQTRALTEEQRTGLPGASLIGYAKGVLGMGEHVRMTAEALAQTDASYGVYNFSVGVLNRQSDEYKAAHPQIKKNKFKANIFHVNADQMLNAYTNLGPDFFKSRCNIGYWAWELPKCPDPWVPIIGMIDEIWAPSRFIQQCFSKVTDKPVTYMPLCVELPSFARLDRDHFKLPTGHFLFLYMFDFMSYIDRKNPSAAILAFKSAFPQRSAKAGLVLKVMNADANNPKWQDMLRLIDADPRIFVINDVLSRSETLALVDCCDSFVSLHRSEGFGRGPAEAMYLGKPVIVTNFSGNTDFTQFDNSFLVDYELIDVMHDQYVFSEGQFWADANINQAAEHMHLLVTNPEIGEQIGAAGQAFIRKNFSAATTGGIMYRRLTELGLA